MVAFRLLINGHVRLNVRWREDDTVDGDDERRVFAEAAATIRRECDELAAAMRAPIT